MDYVLGHPLGDGDCCIHQNDVNHLLMETDKSRENYGDEHRTRTS